MCASNTSTTFDAFDEGIDFTVVSEDTCLIRHATCFALINTNIDQKPFLPCNKEGKKK